MDLRVSEPSERDVTVCIMIYVCEHIRLVPVSPRTEKKKRITNSYSEQFQ
jgi:hypothetical protein